MPRLDRAAALQERHERLLFERAFPRNAAALVRANRALARIERLARPLKDELENSGIAGTVYRYPFNHRMTRWLSDRYGRAVEIDWTAYKRHEWDEIAAMLSLCVAWAENQGLDDDDLGSWDWVKLARAGRRGTDLAWLLAMLARRRFPIELERHLLESTSLPLVWDLAGSRDATTNLRLPVSRLHYYRKLELSRPPDFSAAVRQSAPPLVLLAPRTANRVIDAARAALSQREREFHVIVHANRRETYRHDAGRGLQIYVFGLERPLRLTLEADYGALLVNNGVPIGYGYAALVFDRADLAINIFPEFRAGESAFTFTAFSRLFHRHFGTRTLIMRRYQLGWQNPEGIEAGSFWFYWKLGFRPVDRRVRRLGEEEAARLARRTGARSDEAMLKRLARSDLALTLDGAPVEDFRDVSLKDVGLAVTRLIERRFDGDRSRALVQLTRRVARSLGVKAVPSRLAPVMALIPGLGGWPREERRRVAAMMIAKEGVREGPYVRAMLRVPALQRWLQRRFPV